MTGPDRILSVRLHRGAATRTDEAGGARFPYWSVTKTVIAICALGLAERGRLCLDDAVRDRPFSLRQLLNHTRAFPTTAPCPPIDGPS